MAKGFLEIPEHKGQEEKWEDSVEFLDLDPGEFKRVRMLGLVTPAARHWLTFFRRDKKGKIVFSRDGEAQQTDKRFPLMCLDFDPETEKFTGDECPAHKVDLRAQRIFYVNVIDRDLQENGERNPIRALQLPVTAIKHIKGITKLEGIDPLDPDDGYDLYVKFDPDEDASSMWAIQKGDKAPLNKRERMWLRKKLYDFDELVTFPSVEDVEESIKRCGYYELTEDEDYDEVDEEEEPSRSKKKKTATRGKSPAKAKASTTKKKRRPSRDEEEDEEEEDEDEEGEDEDFDEMDDEDQLDEDEEEEEEPPRRKKRTTKKATSRSKSKSRSKDDDEDEDEEEDEPEEDEDEEDEDEEEDEPPRKKRRTARRGRRSSRRSSDDDDEEEEEEEEDEPEEDEDDDEEEDEPPREKRRTASRGKSKRAAPKRKIRRVPAKSTKATPDCMGHFNGSPPCIKCKVRVACISESEDDE